MPDGPGVDLIAEPQHARRAVVRDDGGGSGGLADRISEQARAEGGGGWLVGVAGGVEAEGGVEVDHAAGLVLGDLDVPDRGEVAELPLSEPGQAGKMAGQVGGEPQQGQPPARRLTPHPPPRPKPTITGRGSLPRACRGTILVSGCMLIGRLS